MSFLSSLAQRAVGDGWSIAWLMGQVPPLPLPPSLHLCLKLMYRLLHTTLLQTLFTRPVYTHWHARWLMESNSHTDTYTGGFASSNPLLSTASFLHQSSRTTSPPCTGCGISLGMVPAFAVKQHQAPKTLLKSCPASPLWLLSTQTPPLSLGERLPALGLASRQQY